MELYAYQNLVARHLRQGRSVILQAPTGAGKTFAALWPYLERWEKNEPSLFPRRCIYSVPMRILAKDFVRSTWELIQEKLILTENPRIQIQTGDQPRDRKLEGDLIFTTIDQSLSSLLGSPYALSGSKSNLNAGSLVGAYLVFDEYHLFPTTYDGGVGALGATLEMLKLLQGITPFCLMTATFSENMLTTLAHLLGAEVVGVSEAELIKIETNQAGQRRERRFQVIAEEMTAQAILDRSGSAQRIIVVRNRVDRAQSLYQEMVELVGEEEVMLLHARFLRQDRDALETRAMNEFGKDRTVHTKGRLILVATQVVEVGLDVSCEMMHTEVAPANAVVQRAGRCARRPGDQGQVFIYDVPSDSKRPYLPYSEALCQATLAAFKPYEGQIVRFQEEQAIINEVHNATDQRLLDSLQHREQDTLQAIENIMMLGDPSQRSTLIRRVDNRTLLVHDQPDLLDNPLACEGFPLFRWSLKGKWAELEDQAAEMGLDYALHYPQEGETYDMGQATVAYQWLPVTDESLLNMPLPFVIHPKLVAYDAKLGFRFDFQEKGDLFRTDPAPDKSDQYKDSYTYDLETYQEHIQAMLRIYQRDLKAYLAYIGPKLEALMQLKEGAVEQAARLVIALHDVGKLDETWQRWAHNYQQAIGNPVPTDYMVAHTLSQTEAHREIDKSIKPRRPHHAGEGAVASAKILAAAADAWATASEGRSDLFKAMLTAIVRHHSARADSFKEFHLHPAAPTAIQEAVAMAQLENLPFALHPYKAIQLEDRILKTDDEWVAWFLYFVLVRALILADHRSQSEAI